MGNKSVVIAVVLGLGAVLALLRLGGRELPAQAAPTAPAAELHVCPSGCTYSSVQAAVDAAQEGDLIKVAQGTYTDVHHIASLDTSTFTATQIVAITKSLTIQGGYTTTNWTTPDPEAHPTILDAQGSGRVMVISGPITPTVEGLRFTGGDATGLGGTPWGDGGGGVYVVTATATLERLTIVSNTALYGGGLYLNQSGTRILSSTIQANRQNAGGGGGLYLYYSNGAVVAGTSITGNRAGNGGGMFLLWCNGVLIEENVIVANEGGYEGGGIRLGTSTATLRGNLISGNQASYGGGISFFAYGQQPALEGNRIVSNTAGVRGGGLYFNYLSPARLVNNVIADNQAPQGSALYVRDSSPVLLHTTIARNGGGPGVVVASESIYFDSRVAMTNTILFSHTVGITVAAGNTVTLNATLWQANGTDRGGAGTISHSGDSSGDPAFAADGYHLTSGSAALNRGVDAGVTTDIDGDRRPSGSGYDLGADEMAFPVYLPLVMRNR